MAQGAVKSGSAGGLRRRRLLSAWLFMVPLLIVNLLVILGPSVATIYYSFTEWSGIGPAEWVGLQNYRDIVADVDEETREVVLVIHWKGGRHSELRVRKPRTGEHGCNTPEAALAVMRSMATRWSDEDIAASLNRMGMRSGQNKSWTAKRVSSLRRVHGIHAYRSAEKDGEWLTMLEAARALGVTSHVIRRLIKGSVLAAEQVVPRAPYQIRAADLQDPRIAAALAARCGPRHSDRQSQLPIFPDT